MRKVALMTKKILVTEDLVQEGIDSLTEHGYEVDKLIADQAKSSDPTQRNDDMFQAFDIITQDVPYVFLYYPVKNIAMNKAYTGVTMNASWIWNIHFQSVHPVSEG